MEAGGDGAHLRPLPVLTGHGSLVYNMGWRFGKVRGGRCSVTVLHGAGGAAHLLLTLDVK